MFYYYYTDFISALYAAVEVDDIWLGWQLTQQKLQQQQQKLHQQKLKHKWHEERTEA